MTVPVPARHLATDDDLFFRRPAEEAAAAVVLNDFGSRVLAADAATESMLLLRCLLLRQAVRVVRCTNAFQKMSKMCSLDQVVTTSNDDDDDVLSLSL